MRVVMPRGACGNGCLDLTLWSRWRCRSVVTRAVAITARARWWAAARAGAGSEAVAPPARTVPIRVRRAVVNDRCRAATGCPVRGPFANGAAMAAAERVAARTSSVPTIQAACSWRISSGWPSAGSPRCPGPASWMADLASRSAVSEPSHRHR